MDSKEELVAKLKVQIIEALKLEDKKPEDINPDEPLFMDGLGLDSIDALELIVILEKNYGLKIETAEEGKTIFKTVHTMADYIISKKSA